MKKISLVILTACSIFAFGQKVSDYQYISLPSKFESFKQDYGLADMLSKTLTNKNYTVIPSDKLQWPVEAKANPCNVLMADVVNDSGFLRNKVLLQFKDCNDKVLSSVKGVSSIKEFKEGFQDALKQTFVSVSPSSPVVQANPANTTATMSSVTDTKETEISGSASSDNNAITFSNGKADVMKVQLDNNQFILVNSNSSSPYATFKATTKTDVFRVKLQNGETTLGYYESGNIVIEMPKGNGEYFKEIFVKK
ncbi:hypothetical protein [Chryseobacterium profundimaris]|uniref:Beta-lactamase-inhibitor-like PepSY-like domain-containing protein n=1 Tax=Chryseobacterium profundimaris TaxID=1387275 RepID=A0ABY1PBJ7_9FLAO|nr:hypothetical protein [Chryseobacterium profundimaris]SMP30830.1 hypothetical protein SAMN06264346_1139 [Chryseobacterium profundimaris]